MYQSSLYVSHIPNREIRIRVKDSDSFYNFRGIIGTGVHPLVAAAVYVGGIIHHKGGFSMAVYFKKITDSNRGVCLIFPPWFFLQGLCSCHLIPKPLCASYFLHFSKYLRWCLPQPRQTKLRKRFHFFCRVNSS